jgi:hypothetical protein
VVLEIIFITVLGVVLVSRRYLEWTLHSELRLYEFDPVKTEKQKSFTLHQNIKKLNIIRSPFPRSLDVLSGFDFSPF